MIGHGLVIERRGGLLIVRDDLIPGGTKARVLPALLAPGREYVYASSAYGYAQVALAYACRAVGARAHIFTAQRRAWHPRTLEAIAAGAAVTPVPYGYLSNVTAKARAYAVERAAVLLPFGFDSEPFREALTALALALALPLEQPPVEVWSVAGSGTLTRALQAAWPGALAHAVLIGSEADTGRAVVHRAPERFEADARERPPFPSCSNYDAKAWRFVSRHASPGALFWNVAA